MRWLLLDAGLVVLALLALAGVGLHLYSAVSDLGREVGRTGEGLRGAAERLHSALQQRTKATEGFVAAYDPSVSGPPRETR